MSQDIERRRTTAATVDPSHKQAAIPQRGLASFALMLTAASASDLYFGRRAGLFLAVLTFAALLVPSWRSTDSRSCAKAPAFALWFMTVVFYIRGHLNSNLAYYRNVLLFLAPLAFLLGRRIGSSSATTTRYIKLLLWFTSAMAAVGIVEYLSSKALFPGASLPGVADRYGRHRASALYEQPLVFSVAAISAIPLLLATRAKNAGTRLGLIFRIALLASSAATAVSRGALPLAALGIALLFAGVMLTGRRRLANLRRPLALVTVLFFATLVALLSGRGIHIGEAPGSTGVQTSASYRSALYVEAGNSLLTRPLGSGLGSIPAGEHLIESENETLDASATTDSEIALSIFQTGWFGLVLACVALPFLFSRFMSALAVGDMLGAAAAGLLLVVFGAGYYLALHVWIYFVMTGGLFAGISSARPIRNPLEVAS